MLYRPRESIIISILKSFEIAFANLIVRFDYHNPIMPLSEPLNERTVLIYDRDGTLHPERFDIACHACLEWGGS